MRIAREHRVPGRRARRSDHPVVRAREAESLVSDDLPGALHGVREGLRGDERVVAFLRVTDVARGGLRAGRGRRGRRAVLRHRRLRVVRETRERRDALDRREPQRIDEEPCARARHLGARCVDEGAQRDLLVRLVAEVERLEPGHGEHVGCRPRCERVGHDPQHARGELLVARGEACIELRDPVRVRVEPGALLGRGQLEHRLAGARETDGAHRDVVVDEAGRGIAEDLGQAPGGRAPDQLELRGPIARSLVALHAHRIDDARRADVNHAVRVAHDVDGRRETVHGLSRRDRHAVVAAGSGRASVIAAPATRECVGEEDGQGQCDGRNDTQRAELAHEARSAQCERASQPQPQEFWNERCEDVQT